MDEIENEPESNIVFDTIEWKQDYANIMFNLSRYDKETASHVESEYIAICERAWCADVAHYIVELENKLHSVLSKW